jgi:hypothetical protein
VTDTLLTGYRDRGWCLFPHDPALLAWVRASLGAARAAVAAPEHAHWQRCGGTWFAGVHALPNDTRGAVAGGPALLGMAISFIHTTLGIGAFDWDRGQISVCYPGYPKPQAGESEGQFNYRRNRDGAHVDGLHAEGAARRRHLREHHVFILGVPMVEAGAGASPFTIWEGSHEVMRAMFRKALAGTRPDRWGDADLTDAYQAARRTVFAECPRVEITASPGQAYLVHRLALHGMAPWAEGAECGPDGRMIVYFRPPGRDPLNWLEGP